MFFFPYRAELSHHRFPILTLIVCVTCAVLTIFQWHLDGKREDAFAAFCAKPGGQLYETVLNQVFGKDDEKACRKLMHHLSRTDDIRGFIDQNVIQGLRLKAYSAPASKEVLATAIIDQYRSFEASVPDALTPQVWYEPASLNPLRALTATFAHSTWRHLLGNLFFFFAFSAAVETLLGRARYVAVFISISLGAFAGNSIMDYFWSDQPPTLGLSGVVFGMMGLFAWFMPFRGMYCFFWFLIFVRQLVLPAWLFFVWYVVFDTVQFLVFDGDQNVNLIAHLGGGAMGYGIGLVFLRSTRRRIISAEADLRTEQVTDTSDFGANQLETNPVGSIEPGLIKPDSVK